MSLISNCVVECPFCRFKRAEEMASSVKLKEYRCASCGASIKTRDGDCCIYCSYGSVICPDQQDKRDCCSG